MQMEPVFGYLVGEFRLRPTAEGALALHDCFCATNALARLRHPSTLLPPGNPQLSAQIETLRNALGPAGSPTASSSEGEDPGPPRIPVVPRYLFDSIIEALAGVEGDPLRNPARDFDPALSAYENLSGGSLTPAQRHFVDNVWPQLVRPRLTGAGFWSIANVG